MRSINVCAASLWHRAASCTTLARPSALHHAARTRHTRLRRVCLCVCVSLSLSLSLALSLARALSPNFVVPRLCFTHTAPRLTPHCCGTFPPLVCRLQQIAPHTCNHNCFFVCCCCCRRESLAGLERRHRHPIVDTFRRRRILRDRRKRQHSLVQTTRWDMGGLRAYKHSGRRRRATKG